MISNAVIAKQVSDLARDFELKLQESLERVKEVCPPEEYAAYKKATGRVVSRIVFDLLEPLYDRNPTLKPPQWNE